MSDLTLAAILTRRAATHPGKVAFSDGEGSLTYAQLEEEAGALAAGLAALGVAAGDHVVLVLPAGLDFVRLFWAVQRLGAASCALNPQAPAQTVAARAARVRPRLVVRSLEEIPVDRACRTDRTDRTDKTDGTPRESGGPMGPISPTSPISPIADPLAFLQPTSGTSGESRAVMIRHRNILAVLQASEEALGIGAKDVLVSWVPPWHDLGLVRFVIGTVHAGATCHIVPPAIGTIPLWFETITRVRGTITGAPDFAWRLATRLVDPARVDLSSLRYATNGGEPVRLSTVEAFEARFGIRGVLCPAYGLAEATLGVSTVLPGEPVRTDGHGNVSCGRPFPRVEVRIDGGDTGEILVRGPGVFDGYFDAPEAAAVRDGWLHTGDIGRFDERGLFVLGRRRAMLKRGGAVLAPRELEEAAQSVEGVRIAAAVGLARPELVSEEIVLAVEIDDSASARTTAGAVAEAVQRAIGFAPERVLVLAPRAIPRTYNGKIRHDVLRTQLIDGALQDAVVFSGGS